MPTNISEAIKAGTRTELFFYADGFVYTDKQRKARIRSRGALETTERKIELVTPEEIDAALLEVVRLGRIGNIKHIFPSTSPVRVGCRAAELSLGDGSRHVFPALSPISPRHIFDGR